MTARGAQPRVAERLALGGVLVVCALFFLHAWALRFTMDDTYISLRYAQNLVAGHGLVFNPGERVEGLRGHLLRVPRECLAALLGQRQAATVRRRRYSGGS